MAMSEAAKEAKRRYEKEWRKKNPEKQRARQERYWKKKAKEQGLKESK